MAGHDELAGDGEGIAAVTTGEPPSYRQIVEAENRDPPVGWEVSLGGQRLGWALDRHKMRSNGPDGNSRPRSLRYMPLDAIIPAWLRPISRFIGKPDEKMSMDASTELAIDTFGRLFRFDSCVQLEPLDNAVTMQGLVDRGQLILTVRSGKLSFVHEVSLPPKALLADVLSPPSRLPGLHVGQTWSVPAINPLGWDKSPIEIIQANVEDPEPISWNGSMVNALRVVYRNDSGSGNNSEVPKGTLWVRQRRRGVETAGDVHQFDAPVCPPAGQNNRQNRRGRRQAVVDDRQQSADTQNHD